MALTVDGVYVAFVVEGLWSILSASSVNISKNYDFIPGEVVRKQLILLS
jgi:hypothetical protein